MIINRRRWTGHTTTARRSAALVALVGITAPLVTVLASSPAASAIAKAAPCAPAQHIAGSVTWPAAAWKVCVPGAIAQSSPSVVTYEGTTYLAVGDENGDVHVLNAATGLEINGFPRAMARPAGANASIESSPTFAFLDGPNKPPSVVASAGSTWVDKSVGEVEAFKLSGAHRWTFDVGVATGTTAGVFATPAVGYLTSAKFPDLVFGSWDHDIYAVDRRGHLLPGFPVNNADTIWSSAAVLGKDIILGSDASGLKGCTGGFLSDYRYESGPKLVWQHCFNQVIWSSPSIGTLGGRPVVVVGTGYYRNPLPSATDKIFAFYANNGAMVPGWPVRTTGPTFGSPAIGVLGSSGKPAVVDISWDCSSAQKTSCATNSVVSAWGAHGDRLWSTDLLGPEPLGSPVIAPLTSASHGDVLVGTPNAVYPLSGDNGSTMFGTNTSNPYASINPSCRVFNSVAVADVTSQGGNDAGWRLFEACGGPRQFDVAGEIAAYPLPSSTTSASWPMFHGGPDHTGLVAAT